MNKKEFDEWARKMLARKPKRYSCYRIPSTDTIICVDEKNGNVGIARCHPDDKFVTSYGKAIAIARCAGKEVPTLNEYKTVGELKNGDVFMYKGRKYLYIGKISMHNHAVINVSTDKLMNYRHYDYKEVEICS